MEVLRTTGITGFYTCPYKAKNEPYNPNPNNTYHGDLLNIGVTSTNADFEPLLKYYANNINPDYKSNIVLKELMEKVKEWIRRERVKAVERWDQLYQETKLYYRFNREVWIEWQPDVFVIHKEPDEDLVQAHCYDLKCSTHSRYSWDEMWDLNMQTYIYPMMIMQVFGFTECKFTYIVWDKKSGKLKQETKIRTLSECKKKIDEVMEDYLQNNLTENYPARENKLCAFCSFWAKGDKTCPLIKARKPKIVKTEDIKIEEDLFS